MLAQRNSIKKCVFLVSQVNGCYTIVNLGASATLPTNMLLFGWLLAFLAAGEMCLREMCDDQFHVIFFNDTPPRNLTLMAG